MRMSKKTCLAILLLISGLLSIQRPNESPPDENSLPTSAKKSVKDSIHIPKPTFYLHVGLHKTGTTFLQHALSDNFIFSEPLFLKDNLVYLGTGTADTSRDKQHPNLFVRHDIHSVFDNFISTGTGYVDLTRKGYVPETNTDYYFTDHHFFMTRIEELRKTGHNVLMVYEVCSLFTHSMIKRLKDLLTANWNVKILVVHRNFHDWLISLHHEIYQPTIYDDWNKRVLPFDLGMNETVSAQIFSEVEKNAIHPARRVQKIYQRHFEDVDLISLEQVSTLQAPSSQGDALLEHVLCHFIDHAPSACQIARSGAINTGSGERHSHRSLTYALIAQEAHQQGLVPDEAEHLAVAKAIEDYLTSQGWSSSELPQTCPSQRALAHFERVSIEVDRMILNWTNAQTTLHHESFRELLKKHSQLCYVDAKAVLEDDEIRSFFMHRLWV